ENGFYRSLVLTQTGTSSDDSQDKEDNVVPLDDGHHDTSVVAKHNIHPTNPKKVSNTSSVAPQQVDLSRIFALTKPERSLFILGIASCLLQGVSNPAVSLIISRVINDMNKHYVVYLESGKQDTDALTALYDNVAHLSYIFVGVAVAMFFVGFINTYTFRIVAEKLTTRLRNLHFQALMRQDIGFFDLPGNTTG
ncbi:unnamed protein product, partial [Aphanomyces euteiches]